MAARSRRRSLRVIYHEAHARMTPNLGTTNLLLGIMAAVTLLEVFAVVGVFLAGYFLYRRIRQVIHGIEERQVAPTRARVNAILDDVKGVGATVKAEASRFRAAASHVVDWMRRSRERRADRPRS
jgi:hypothetical protein